MSFAVYQAGLFVLNRPEPIRQSTLLMTLATGLDDPTALMEGLNAICLESRPKWGRRIESIIDGLEQGRSLSDVLAEDPTLLPAKTVGAINVAEKTGGLRQVLADEAIRISKPESSDAGTLLQALVPIGVVLATAFMIVSFIMLFIIPKFKKIFEDFDTDLPQITIALIDFSDWFFSYWYLVLPNIMITAFYLLKWQHRWATRKELPLQGFFQSWWTPHILKLMGHSIAANGNLHDTFNQIRNHLPDGRVARSISAAQVEFESGKDCWSSLQQQGFLSNRDVAFLDAARTSGHADWGLLHLSRAKSLTQQRWLKAISQVLPILALVSVGVVIMLICVSLFMPLLKLINDLA